MKRFLALYVAAALVFFPLDMVFLGRVARNFYKAQLGDLLLPQPNWGVAVAFYALYLVGIVVFVLQPAAEAGPSWPSVLGQGALFGLVAYGTYDLTNLATMRGFPPSIAIFDMIWGAVLTGVSAAIGLALAGFVTDLR